MRGNLFIKKNTRGFLPITIDIETSGSDPKRHGILEIAAHVPYFEESGVKSIFFHRHTQLESEAEIDPEASLVHGIPIEHPFRYAVTVEEMLEDLRDFIQEHCDRMRARRAMVVAHNPSFDMAFIQKACLRYGISLHMHQYTFLDTASMGLVRHKETVLAKLCQKEGLGFMHNEAHSALYDTHMTARLFWSFMGEKLHRNLEEASIV